MADYVDRMSLGKASSYSIMGAIAGDVFAIGVLMPITQYMSHEYAFMTIAAFTALITMPLFKMITEPNLIHSHNKKELE